MHLRPADQVGLFIINSDTGEPTTRIITRSDDEAWPRAKAAMECGATLHRPHRLQTYWAHDGVDYVSGTGLSKTRVRHLERQGVIEHVGVGRYALVQK
jgi:hypothetical protein